VDIKIHYQDVKFRLKDSALTRKWLQFTVEDRGYKVGRVDYFFIDNKSQREINSEFLEHHYNTDVITFDYSEGKEIYGEIYIAIETVRENSRLFKTKFREELIRVMIHGILHLMGYDDRSEMQKNEMRRMENHYLDKLEDGRTGL